MTIEEQLIAHEGLKTRVYYDSLGTPTIGVGRNLRDRGLTHEEVMYLLANDIKRVKKELYLELPLLFPSLSPIRQRVLIDLSFNLGTNGMMNFKRMLDALADGDFHKAALEMKNSKWATQVQKSRVARLIHMMEYDEEI